jgi:hypothetical protein
MTSCGMTYVRLFMMIGSDIRVIRILRLLLQQIWRPQYSYCWWKKSMKSAVEMTSGGLICIPSFMTIGSSIQAIWRILPKNLRGCSVGITEERDLLHSHWDSLRCHDIHNKFHDARFRRSANIKLLNSTVWEAAVLMLRTTGIYEVRH